jgi:type II restriction enzyme
LNAGKTTNFIFKINNLTLNQNQILEINEIETRSKIKDRIGKITELGGKLSSKKQKVPFLETT